MSEKIIDTSNYENFRKQHEAFQPPKNRGFKVPYILWGKWVRTFKAPLYQPDIEYTVEAMQFRAVAPSVSKIMYYKSKGYRVLDFWFPTREELPPKKPDQITESGWIGMFRNSENGVDPYSEARSICQSLKNSFFGVQAQNEQINSLKKELEELRAKQNEENTNTARSTKRSAVNSSVE